MIAREIIFVNIVGITEILFKMLFSFVFTQQTKSLCGRASIKKTILAFCVLTEAGLKCTRIWLIFLVSTVTSLVSTIILQFSFYCGHNCILFNFINIGNSNTLVTSTIAAKALLSFLQFLSLLH